MIQTPVPQAVAPTPDKKYELAFVLKGPGGTVVAPNKQNPVIGKDLASVLQHVTDNFPTFNFGIEVVGISLREVE